MDTKTQLYYARSAERLAEEYGNCNPGLAHRMELAFAGHRRILDVGCGTGRDLIWLLKNGKDAVGIDPSIEMLREAAGKLKSADLDQSDCLFEGGLPDLGLFRDGEFDGVMCSAVLMHLPDDQIFDAVYALRRVLRPGGALLVSIPETRDDVDSTSRRDKGGRLFTELPTAKLHLLFERVGFVLRESESVADSLGRAGVHWRVSEFRLDESSDRPLHLVESILSRDKKDATYKLALFRALAEIAQTQHHLASFANDGKVKIPVQAIADKWIFYYWPIFESEIFICQRTGESLGGANGVSIRAPLEALIACFRASGGLTGFHSALSSGRLSPDAKRLWIAARSKFQSTIWSMPVRHAGGGHFDVFQYDRGDKSVCMDSKLWRELCLTGSWIQDATVLRWAELTEQLSKGSVRASTVIDCLLAVPDPARNVNDARSYYCKMGEQICVWSGVSLRDGMFDVDHAMPFSLWRNNELWNLFPTDPLINSSKSDKLPSYQQLKRSREPVIDCWQALNSALGDQFQREAKTLLGRDKFASTNWENQLFSRFIEAFEVTASQRGAPRWESPSLTRSAFAQGSLSRSTKGSARATIRRFSELGAGAFKTHLPLVGRLAAGPAFHGFITGSLDNATELDWIEVPKRLARERRFVVRVDGDSMSPFLESGQLAVFEYHRSPRRDGEIVIANLPEFGIGEHGTETIKRIRQDAYHWIFQADNPAYPDIPVSKYLTNSPILGVLIEKL